MKYLTFFLLFALNAVAEKPEAILPKTKELRPLRWYKEQAIIWKTEISNNQKNASAWLNYYAAARFSQSEKDQLNNIVLEMGNSAGDSYEFFVVKAWNEGFSSQGYADIQKAYKLNPEKVNSYGLLTLFAEVNQNPEQRLEFSKKLFESGQVSQSLLSYSYNVLMSVEENAVLFTEGESTTLPLFLLQDIFQVRGDVLVLDLDLFDNPEYASKKLQSGHLKFSLDPIADRSLLCAQLPVDNTDKKFYYALTLSKDNISSIKDHLYVTGLASQLSQTRMDNLVVIKDNMEKRFLMDYLLVDFNGESEYSAGKVLSSNYLVPMLLLNDFYNTPRRIDESFKFEQALEQAKKSSKLKSLLMKIAQVSKQQTIVTNYLSRKSEESPYGIFDPESRALEVSVKPVNETIYAGEYEITNELYYRFLAYLKKQGLNDLYELYKRDYSGDSLRGYVIRNYSYLYNYIKVQKKNPVLQMPMSSITYEAASAYCDWLTEQYNKTPGKKFAKVRFRLPTVDEWQIAALGYKHFTSWKIDENMINVIIPDNPNDPYGKGKEKTISAKDNEILYPWYKWYNFRNSPVNNKGCYLGNFKVPETAIPCQPKMETADGFRMTSMVGAYFPNEMGLYDMVGNIAEMTNEKGIAVGGSWDHTPEQSTIRSINEYNKPYGAVGFRVFMEVIEQ